MAISNLLIFGTEGDDSFAFEDFATVYGLGGDDEYFDLFGTQIIIEQPGEGTDRILTAVSGYTLPANVEILLFLDTGAGVAGFGNAANNRIEGTEQEDTLDGGAGRDTLVGGDGQDVYIVDNTLDAIVELPDDGIDAVEARISYILPANVELLTLANGALNGTGNALDNTITGTDGNNVLRGMAGGDNIEGGAGNDLLDGGDGHDGLLGGLGNDILIGGAGSDVMNGQEGNDNLSGGAGDDILNGGIGKDTLTGGLGNDQFSLGDDGAGIDAVLEAAGQGTDTVFTDYITYVLPTNVEVLIADAGTSQGVNYTGNTGNNSIYGSEFADQLFGLGGNDFLDGGNDGEADTLNGGLGNDTYSVLTANDRVVELPGQGTDTVLAQTDYMLPDNVENLTLLTFSGASNGWGNAGNNSIQGGTRLEGFAGNDTLEGGGIGAHVLIGGAGNDLYRLHSVLEDIIERANEGVDSAVLTVNSSGIYHMALNLEHLQIIAPDGWQVFGNESANRITATSHHDELDGGIGNDTLTGGGGDDDYFVDSSLDVVIEAAGQGNDRILSAVSVAMLAANVEDLVLLGAAQNAVGNALSNIILGNALANVLDGGIGNDFLSGGFDQDTLIGGAGNDTLDGGSGGDVMTGGAGNDHYIADADEFITEAAGGGTDLIESSRYATTIVPQVENLVLAAGSFATIGFGNGLANHITGNARNNVLDGFAGNDILDGMGGDDTMSGGVGNDTYHVGSVGDAVSENPGEGIDTVIREQMGADYTLPGNVENLTIAGWENGSVTGNDLNNVIRDDSGQPFAMSGGIGADTLVAGGGNDTLDGGAGNDLMQGGPGNDTYFVDAAGDLVVEAANAGFDHVSVSGLGSYTLPANVESATMSSAGSATLRGNALDNLLVIDGEGGNDLLDGGAGNDDLTAANTNDTLLGGAGNDLLIGLFGVDRLDGGTGNDDLRGGAGNDLMIGGLGDDTYSVDSGDGAGGTTTGTAEDQVNELAGQGTDKVITETSSYVLPINIENVQVILPANADQFPAPYSYFVTGTGTANELDLAGSALITATGLGGDDVFRVSTGSVFYFGVGSPATPSYKIHGGNGADRAEITLNTNLVLETTELETIDLRLNADSVITTAGTGFGGAVTVVIRGGSDLTLPALQGSTAGGPSYRVEDYAGKLNLAVLNAAGGGNDNVSLALVRSLLELTLADVELVRLDVVDGLGFSNVIDVAGVTGLNVLTVTGNSSLSINGNISAIDKLDLEHFSGGTLALVAATPASQQNVDARLIASVVTALDVSGLGADGDIINIAALTGGVSRIRLTGEDANDLINITGDGTLVLEEIGADFITAADFAGTLRATYESPMGFAATGTNNGRYDLTGSNAGESYTMGRALDSLDRINGGSAGDDSDILSANVTNRQFATGALNITNVEVINLSIDPGAGAQLDWAAVIGAHTVNIGGGNAASGILVVNATGNWNAASYTGIVNIESPTTFHVVGGSGNDAFRVLGNESGASTLNGGEGNDTLRGGGGADTFRFDTALDGITNVDTIEDFDVNIGDVLELENSIFLALAAPGVLAAANFFTTDQPIDGNDGDADDFVQYNRATGQVFYDANGSTPGELTLVAFVQVGPVNIYPLLTAADFVVT